MVVSGDVVVSVTSVDVTVVLDGPVTVVAAIEEIGRESCREKVYIYLFAVSLKKRVWGS